MHATRTSGVLVLAFSLLLGACAGTGSSGHERLTFSLQGIHQNLGATGQATFARQGSETAVSITIARIPPQITRPLRIQVFIYPGTCNNPGAQAKFSLNDKVTTNTLDGSLWQLSRSVDTPLDTFLPGEFALFVRTMPYDGNLDIFCGELRQPP